MCIYSTWEEGLCWERLSVDLLISAPTEWMKERFSTNLKQFKARCRKFLREIIYRKAFRCWKLKCQAFVPAEAKSQAQYCLVPILNLDSLSRNANLRQGNVKYGKVQQRKTRRAT